MNMAQRNSLTSHARSMLFSFCSLKTLINSVIPVCKTWKEEGSDLLKIELDFSRYCDLPSDESRLSVARYVKKIILHGGQDLDTAKLRFLLNNSEPVLEEIDAEGCLEVDANVIDALPNAKTLRKFNFSHCTNDDLTDACFIWLASKVEKIEFLNIAGIPGINNSVFSAIISDHVEYLQEMVLNADELNDEGFGTIAKCTNLRKLHVLCCQHLTHKSLEYIQALTHLTSLKMRGVKFTEEGLDSRFTKESMPDLVELDISEST